MIKLIDFVGKLKEDMECGFMCPNNDGLREAIVKTADIADNRFMVEFADGSKFVIQITKVG